MVESSLDVFGGPSCLRLVICLPGWGLSECGAGWLGADGMDIAGMSMGDMSAMPSDWQPLGADNGRLPVAATMCVPPR